MSTALVFNRGEGESGAPEKHAGLGRVPLREPVELLAHVALEHVALLPVELGHGERVREERVVPPRLEQRERDRLRERRRLQARHRRLLVVVSSVGSGTVERYQ